MSGLENINGNTAFYARQDAYHRLGQIVPDGVATIEEVMDLALLSNWNVRSQPIFTEVTTPAVLTEDGVTPESTIRIPVTEKVANIRDNPVTGQPEFLAVVGKDYKIFQNEEKANFLMAVVEESGGSVTTAGSLKGGTQTFLGIKAPSTISIGGVDPIDTYITALNSHDGSLAFTLIAGLVRVECTNSQSAALKEAQSVYRVRHTKNASTNVSEARQALDILFKYNEEFEKAANELIERSFSDDQFDKFLVELFGTAKADSQAANTRFQNRSEDLKNLFTGSETNKGIRGTRWGAYQAITEWTDFYAGDVDQDKRASRTLTTGVVSLKEKSFKLLQGV